MNITQETLILQRFGKHLRAIRERKGLSLRELADLADMNHGNIHEIEQGKVNPSITTVIILAKAMGLKPAEMLAFDA